MSCFQIKLALFGGALVVGYTGLTSYLAWRALSAAWGWFIQGRTIREDRS